MSRCHSGQQPFQCPLFAGDSRLNRWRGLQRGMLAAPVVPSKVQTKHRIVIAGLFGRRIRQPSVSAKRHLVRQMESFHAAGSDFVFWNVTADHGFGDRCYRSR